MVIDSEPALILYSSGLLSRWGFNDGDLPEGLADYLDDHGVAYPDWPPVLCRLVTEHLLPAVREHHDVEIIIFSTHHNPIRAVLVDGASVDQWWPELAGGPPMTPACVAVPYSVVAAACGAAVPGHETGSSPGGTAGRSVGGGGPADGSG